MRVMILLALLAAGCTSDEQDAQAACGGLVMYQDQMQCRASYLAGVQNRRAAALAIIGAGLANYGAQQAQPAYVAPTHTSCYRFVNTVQCNSW
jgi:hypothetical protein